MPSRQFNQARTRVKLYEMRVPISTHSSLHSNRTWSSEKGQRCYFSPPTPCFPLSLPERSMEGYIPSNGLLGIRTRPPHTYYDNCCGCYNRQAYDVFSVSTCKLSHSHHPPPFSRYSPLCYAALLSTVPVYTKHVRKAYLCVTAASPWHTSFRPHGRPSNQSCCTKSCGHSFIRLNKSPEHSF